MEELEELLIVMRPWGVSMTRSHKRKRTNASPSLMRSVAPKKLLARSFKNCRAEPSFLFSDGSSNLEQQCYQRGYLKTSQLRLLYVSALLAISVRVIFPKCAE